MLAAGDSRQQLAHRPNAPPYYLPCLGQKDLALECLEKALAVRDPDLCSMGVEPDLDLVRTEPSFQAMPVRVGLSH